MFEDETKLEEMSKIAKSKSKPDSTKLISKDIGDIALRTTCDLPVLKSSM